VKSSRTREDEAKVDAWLRTPVINDDVAVREKGRPVGPSTERTTMDAIARG
jgi:hypothetical protein